MIFNPFGKRNTGPGEAQATPSDFSEFRGGFGKRNIAAADRQTAQPQEPRSDGSPADRGRLTNLESRYPWNGQPDYAACNLALGNLVHNVPGKLAVNDRIHAETCVAAIGAIAGFAAQHAMIARLTETGDRATMSQIHRVTTKDGGTYFFGEPLNQMLIPMSDAEAGEKLWSLAAGAAVAAGLEPRHLPNLDAMFSHVAETIGGELDGMPSVPREHYPQLPVRALLKAVWPLALICFSGRTAAGSPHLGEARIRFWPAITAHAANALIRQVQPVLDPGIALTIVMEAAIYASKLDPTTM